MGQTQGKETVEEKPTPRPSLKSNFKPKKHLTRVELVSLQHMFKQLKSTFPDGFSCIETKKFLVKIAIFSLHDETTNTKK